MLAAHFTFFTDPSAWPWDTIIWVVVPLVAGFGKVFLHWIRRRRAESWPSTIGKIEAASVSKTRELTRPHGTSAQVAEINYSYWVDANRYSGQYRKDFRRVGDAWEFVRDLKGMTVTVHYHPSKPSVSTLLDTSIDALQLGRPPLSSSQISPGPTKDAVKIGPKWALLILIAVAALALLFHW